MSNSSYHLPLINQSGERLEFSGAWVTQLISTQLLHDCQSMIFEQHIKHIVLDLRGIEQLDTNVCYLIQQFIDDLQGQGVSCNVAALPDNKNKLFQVIRDYRTSQLSSSQDSVAMQHSVKSWQNIFFNLSQIQVFAWVTSQLEKLGRHAEILKQKVVQALAFVGKITMMIFQWLRAPKRIRWPAIVHVIDSSGYQAMGIVALLSFLIGIVLCYQMGAQLKIYGAGIYVVDFLGIALLREFAPLLTAIIVAGRTGAAFAAQIGTMKLNQEVDALKTMGMSVTELLVLPKVVGLTVALPLLVILSIVCGLLGGMVMAKILFSITYLDFLQRFGKVTLFRTFVLGIIKTPVFAVLIAIVGCFRGLQVSQSAESVGRQTTISVVQAIFMIIVTDAFFSIVYSKLGL